MENAWNPTDVYKEAVKHVNGHVRVKDKSIKRHILIIPSWYKTREMPVYGSFFEEQARGLMKRGHKVGILFPEFTPISSNELSLKEHYDDDGLPTFRIRYKAKVPRWRTFNYRRFGHHVWKYFNQYVSENGHPDIIHAHTVFFGGIAAKYISQKTGIPFVLTEHYTPFITGNIVNKKDLSVAREIFQTARQANVVSGKFRQDLAAKIDLPEHTFRVIHNMVNPLFFQDNRKQVFTKNSKLRLFTNSYLLPRKNHELILNAFHLLLQEYPNAELVIGGDGPLKDELFQTVAFLDMKDKVIFRGLLSREEVHEELNKCHIFLLSSLYETFGVVLIEALAVGRPVITTDCGGPLDIVTSKNGILLGSFEAGEMAQKIKLMMDQYDQYDQGKISEDCLRKFGEDTIINQIQESYNRVLKN